MGPIFYFINQTVYGHVYGVGRGIRHKANPVAESIVELFLVQEGGAVVAAVPEVVYQVITALIECCKLIGGLRICKESIVGLCRCLSADAEYQSYGCEYGVYKFLHRIVQI